MKKERLDLRRGNTYFIPVITQQRGRVDERKLRSAAMNNAPVVPSVFETRPARDILNVFIFRWEPAPFRFVRSIVVNSFLEYCQRLSYPFPLSVYLVSILDGLTSCAEMNAHVENFLSQNCNIFSVSSIFNYNPGETNNKFITYR